MAASVKTYTSTTQASAYVCKIANSVAARAVEDKTSGFYVPMTFFARDDSQVFLFPKGDKRGVVYVNLGTLLMGRGDVYNFEGDVVGSYKDDPSALFSQFIEDWVAKGYYVRDATSPGTTNKRIFNICSLEDSKRLDAHVDGWFVKNGFTIPVLKQEKVAAAVFPSVASAPVRIVGDVPIAHSKAGLPGLPLVAPVIATTQTNISIPQEEWQTVGAVAVVSSTDTAKPLNRKQRRAAMSEPVAQVAEVKPVAQVAEVKPVGIIAPEILPQVAVAVAAFAPVSQTVTMTADELSELLATTVRDALARFGNK
jgi:hypothetical protein